MTTVIRENEAQPTHAENTLAWDRIEAWIAHRWVPRAVLYVVEGAGQWVPRLTPFTVTATEIWNDGWEDVTLSASPLDGLELTCAGPYRIAGTAGDGSTPPETVTEAVARLAAYLATPHCDPGVSDHSVSLGGSLDTSYRRNPAWLARSIINSGAADLLRPYRRAS